MASPAPHKLKELYVSACVLVADLSDARLYEAADFVDQAAVAIRQEMTKPDTDNEGVDDA